MPFKPADPQHGGNDGENERRPRDRTRKEHQDYVPSDPVYLKNEPLADMPILT